MKTCAVSMLAKSTAKSVLIVQLKLWNALPPTAESACALSIAKEYLWRLTVVLSLLICGHSNIPLSCASLPPCGFLWLQICATRCYYVPYPWARWSRIRFQVILSFFCYAGHIEDLSLDLSETHLFLTTTIYSSQVGRLSTQLSTYCSHSLINWGLCVAV